MTLNEILQAIATEIKNKITPLRTCDTHGGRFDLQELLRVAAQSPGVFVSIVSVDDVKSLHGEFEALITFGAFSVAKDTPSADRSAMGLTIVQALASVIPNNMWGLDESVTKPESINAKNLYSGALDKKGVSLWGTTWRQRMSLGTAVNVSDLGDFLLMHMDYDVDADQENEPTTTDDIQLPQ